MDNKRMKTILLVEDEVLIAMSEQMTLEDYGYKVVTAESGEKAIEITDTNPEIDLILMDINLSTKMLGTEAAEAILSKHDLPLIFLSSHIEKEVVRKTEGITSYGYIVKDSGEIVMIASIKMAFRLHDAKLREQNKDKALRKIEWMLNPEQKTKASSELSFPPYGDLLALNTNRLILDSVGKETLGNIVKEFLDLLGTSSAVYERNGDYAFGIFSSNWCNYMDQSSHRLCKTDNLDEALACGKWICHESCWKKASQPSIISGEIVDIECDGGIHLYAVPIRAAGKIVGAINVGYGDPPQDEKTLLELAKKYEVNVEDLKEQAKSYESRPPFIIALAKRRVEAAAFLIGEIVERKLAEKEKSQIAQQWQNTFDSSNDAIWILDKDQNIIRANKRAEEFFELSSAEMLSKKCHEIVHQTNEPIPLCPFVKTLQSGEREEMELQRSDKFYRVTVDPLKNEFNEMIGAVHLITDITEKKQTEAALLASEDRFSKLFYQAPLGYQSLDIDGNLLEVNQKWLDTLGYKREEVIGKWFGGFLTPACQEGFKECFPIFKAQGHIQTEFEMLHRNGEILHIAFDGKIASNLDGSFLQTHCILQNITERKRSEQRINLLADMVDNAPNSITVHDAEGNFLYANKKTLEMHGFSMEEFERLNLHELDVPESEILINQRIEQIQKFGETSFEAEHFKKDGSRLPLEAFVKEVEWFGKKAILSIATDITERKKAEQELNHSYNLMKYIIEHTRSSIAVHDRDLKYIYVSQRYLEEYKVKDENIIGKHHYDVFPDLPQKWRDVHQKVLAGEVLSAEDDPYEREDGSVEWTSWECRPWFEKNGSIGGIIVYTQVITDRKKAQQELETQYRLLKIAGETAKFGGWDVDLKTNISHWSDVVAAIHEMPAGFAPKVEDGIKFYAPEWRDKITEVFTACAEQGIPYDEEMEIITSKGKRKWVRAIGKAIREENGKIYKVHGAFQDISEKKQTELQIVESEKKYSNLYREMLDGFALHEMIFDEKGKPVDYRYLEVNPAFERLTGLKRDTILGKTVLEILPETEFYWIENYGKVVTSQKPIFFENYSKELNKFYQVKAFHTSKNQFATIFSDITELKRNQEKIENLNSLLLAVRNINQIIVQENDLQKIMEKSCESLLETRNYLNIEIALYDDEKKVIKPVAHCGAQKFKDWSITINGEGNAPHCIKETVKLQKPFVIRESDSFCGDCQNYKEDSVHQTILVPMKLQEKLVGILTVRMLPNEHFSKEEIELLVEVGGDLAFARQKHISDNLLNYTLLRYQELFENSRDGFVVCSMNRKIIDANEALCKMLGYSLKELKDLGSNLAIVPERWHEKEREIWKRELLERGFSDVYEKEYIRKDGDIFPIEIQTFVVYDKNGKAEYIWGIVRDITIRKGAIEKAKKRENFLSKVFEILPIGLWFADENGKLLQGNPAGIKIWGAEPKVPIEEYGVFSARRLPSGEEIAPEDWALAHTIKEKVTVSDELLEIDAFDGKKKIIMNYTAPVLDDEGNLLGAIIINNDITEKQKIYDSLKESETRKHSYFEQSPYGIFITDNKGNYLEVNPQACEITGYSKEELERMSIPDLIPKEELAHGIKHFETVLQEGYSYGETTFKTKSGDIRWWSVAATKISDDLLLGFCEDVTERKQLEFDLKESEERFKALHNASFGGIAIHDKGIILECNKGMSEMTGYSYDELIGMDGLKLIAEESREKVMKNILAGCEKPYEAIGQRKNGETYPLQLEARNVHYKGKQVRTVEFRDITEHKQAEEEIKQLLEEKETLLKEVHHRIKNNMSVVQSLLSLQAKAIDNENCKSVLQEAAGMLQSMITLYNKLYRSEIGRDLSLEAFLRPLLDDILKVFAKVVDVKTELQIENIVLSAKTLVPLGIILNECITNSIKYAFKEEGNGVIFVTATQKDDTVLLTYSDGKEMVSPELFVKSDTFGLKLIYLLVKQIRGNIRLEKDGVARYVIEFPKKK